ncbi:ribonuclease J [Fervidibacillus halotolerans]|uniref:Ribonuclease J n=1 Tax=Fervidibacillus halotolerans TaxID=2980027 RepID=A0A9E8M229_9BACI|nr:ribonuclease J [Fervidibacillus halotolerans]WAA13552.1 ribonuclease J [Fervidibacillus halotolerans]
MFSLTRKKVKTKKIIPLGGVGELGKNMYIVEVGNDLFVIDAGLKFPEDEMYGIDIVIPDITYLLENKERIQGVFLSHGHEDHTGALAYLMDKIPVPVYGTKLTVALTKAKLTEQDFKGKVDFRVIHEDIVLNFPSAKITFFHVNHSIPDSVGICIETDEGSIVYTGDFKFDQSADELYQANISKMAKIGDRGVLCLLSDSTEAEKPGYTPSEVFVEKQLENVFQKADGRIIYACYASSINAIQRMFHIAERMNRKVVMIGKTLQDVFDISYRLGYLHVDRDRIIQYDEMDQYKDEELVVLMTGTQGEPLDALQQMVRKQHGQLHIQKGDTVLIAASPHRGGELFLLKTIDMLYRAGATVFFNQDQIHVSGHGRKEELKLMLNLMKPKFFIPIHGEYKMLVAHGKIASHMGVDRKNMIIPEKGDIIEIKGDQIKLSGRVQAGNVLIDGSGVGDVGNIVLRDRRMLSQDGIFISVVTINRNEKRIVSGPEIISRGFVYVRESEELMMKATKIVRDIVEKNIKNQTFEWANVKQEIRDQLNGFLFNQTKRRPMIIPIIMEV